MTDPNQNQGEGQDLDAMMAETRIVTGTEIFDLPGSSEEEEQTDEGDQEKPGNEEQAQESQELSSQSGEESEQTEEQDGKNFRFKDHGAAEEGFRNLQAKTTRAEQELAEMKKANVQREAEENAVKLAAEKDKASREFAAERQKETLAAINDLDHEDPDYDEKIAKTWAENNVDIINFAQNPQLAVQESQPAEEPGGDRQVETPPRDQGPSNEEIQAYVSQCVNDAGISEEQMPVFQGFVTQTTGVNDDGSEATIGQQVQWAIDQTKKHYADVKAQVRAEMEQPMTRQGQGRGPGGGAKEPEGIVTLEDAMASAREQRRI